MKIRCELILSFCKVAFSPFQITKLTILIHVFSQYDKIN